MASILLALYPFSLPPRKAALWRPAGAVAADVPAGAAPPAEAIIKPSIDHA